MLSLDRFSPFNQIRSLQQTSVNTQLTVVNKDNIYVRKYSITGPYIVKSTGLTATMTPKMAPKKKTTTVKGSGSNEPTTVPEEFGGPIGCFASTILLPVLVMVLAHWSNVGYVDLLGLVDTSSSFDVVFCPSCRLNVMLLLKCTVGLIVYFCIYVALWAALPGKWVEGAPVQGTLKPGYRLQYKLNGHMTFWVIIGVVIGSQVPLNDYLYRYYKELAICDIILCFLLSVYIYLNSFIPDDKVLSIMGNSGYATYDFWMGRELNPRLGEWFDWKQFCELRPGMIGWMLLNFACAQEQYKTQGYVSGSMILLNIFQAFYVWDALYQERAILTTMDITTDGFGFMLLFGDLTWVPFTYSLPARYLVKHDPNLSWPVLVAILALYVAGFSIFRLANRQKDIFRNNPEDPRVANLSYMNTKRGTRLLTSGWWGCARKINYTGDYMMGLTYSLLCGFDSIVPYYYAVYFAVLLVHRSIRDDVLCQEKYGPDWQEYKRQVPYRFIPSVV